MDTLGGYGEAGVPHPLFMVQALTYQLIAEVEPGSWDERRLLTLDKHNQAAILCADRQRDRVSDALELVEQVGPLEWMVAKERVIALLRDAVAALPVLTLGAVVWWSSVSGDLDLRRGRGGRRRDEVCELEGVAA